SAAGEKSGPREQPVVLRVVEVRPVLVVRPPDRAAVEDRQEVLWVRAGGPGDPGDVERLRPPRKLLEEGLDRELPDAEREPDRLQVLLQDLGRSPAVGTVAAGVEDDAAGASAASGERACLREILP